MMRRRSGSLLLFLLALGTASAGAAEAVKLPEASADHVLFAQIADVHVADPKEMAGKRAFVWAAARPLQGQKPFATSYYPSNRDLDRSHTLAWYQQNKPDWVAYACDRKTPAYDHTYAWGAYVPLDITRPEVRRYIFDTYLAPAIAKGYAGIAFDNVSIVNGVHRCGVWRDGKWVQQFSGDTRDPAYAAATLAYIGWVAQQVHGRGAVLALNAKFDAKQPQLTDQLIALSDLWLDEGGFSDGCKRLVTDAVWSAKFAAAAKQAEHGGYVSMNTTCGAFAVLPPPEASWILANFLLVRGTHSYLAVVGEGDGGRLLDYPAAQWDPPIGKPLGPAHGMDGFYVRDYETGKAAVNPSSHAAARYTIPAGTWRDLDGAAVSGTLTLPPRSGIVLIGRAP